jgi:hypothetical protein
MPFAFSSPGPGKVAKPGVISDGDIWTGAPTVLKSGAKATLTLVSTTVTLTGGAGFVSGDTGKKIFISGAATALNNGWFTLTFISATSVSWTNASGATDANNGAISWQEAVLGVSTLAIAPASQFGNTVFTGPPVRTGVGTWSITTRDNVVATCGMDITPVLPAGSYLSIQENTSSVVATTGQRTYNWTFHSAGTPTDLPFPAQMRVYLVYGESKAGM